MTPALPNMPWIVFIDLTVPAIRF